MLRKIKQIRGWRVVNILIYFKLINVGNHSVNNLDTYKLFFMSIPYSIRNWIPLKFWPKFVISNNEAYDEMIDMVKF